MACPSTPTKDRESLLTEPQSNTITAADVKFLVVEHHSAVLQYGAVIESALTLLYLIEEMYYLLPFAVIPLTGFLAGRKLQERLARTYLYYIAMQMLLRISVIINAQHLNTQAAEVLALLVDCLVIRAAWTYVRLLSHVSSEERRSILAWRALKSRMKTGSPEAIDVREFI